MFIMRVAKGTPYFVIYIFKNGKILHTDDLSVVWMCLFVLGMGVVMAYGLLTSLLIWVPFLMWVLLCLFREPWNGSGIERLFKQQEKNNGST